MGIYKLEETKHKYAKGFLVATFYSPLPFSSSDSEIWVAIWGTSS